MRRLKSGAADSVPIQLVPTIQSVPTIEPRRYQITNEGSGLNATNMSKLPQCKLKKKCTVKDAQEVLACENEGCKGFVHSNCSTNMLDYHEIATEDRPLKAGIVFCTKTCFNKWKVQQNKKKRVEAAAKKAAEKGKTKIPWEKDGSMQALLDWLTEEPNYALYCGCNGNKGQSKTQYHKELAILIKEKKPNTDRTDKDVSNKIEKLERQFRNASDWANNTGQGVDEPGDFRKAVLQRCPLYYEYEPIMGDRPNARPLLTNEEEEEEGDSNPLLSDDDEEEEDMFQNPAVASPVPAAAPTAVDISLKPPAVAAATPATTPSPLTANTAVTAASATTKKKKRIVADVSKSNPKKNKVEAADDVVSSYFKHKDLSHIKEREVAAKEKEATARMMEASANSDKAKMETHLLTVQNKVTILRERKKLEQEGYSKEELDEYLPIP